MVQHLATLPYQISNISRIASDNRKQSLLTLTFRECPVVDSWFMTPQLVTRTGRLVSGDNGLSLCLIFWVKFTRWYAPDQIFRLFKIRP